MPKPEYRSPADTGGGTRWMNTPDKAPGMDDPAATMAMMNRMGGNPAAWARQNNVEQNYYADSPAQAAAQLNAANAAGKNPGEFFAAGGAIPVGGRKVLGPGTGTSDSIPAIIDGQRPAALSSGEYVIPARVVAAKGTEFFDKMLAQFDGSKTNGA
jgi:hypothetical protein